MNRAPYPISLITGKQDDPDRRSDEYPDPDGYRSGHFILSCVNLIATQLLNCLYPQYTSNSLAGIV